MEKIAVIIYGSPGAGKGTQANMVADALDLVHFDTGKVLEQVVHDPFRQKSAFVRRERKLFDSGALLTPRFVAGVVEREINRIAVAGVGLVFSGSPRTLYEAGKIFPVLEKRYGKKRIFLFVLDVSADISVKRNSVRLLCKACGAPLLVEYVPIKNPKHCPRCGGPLYRRTIDNKKTIMVRLREYEERTKPIFAFARARGYRIHTIDGRPAPYKVFERIAQVLQQA